jgi:biotin carboxyl carrier protein
MKRRFRVRVNDQVFEVEVEEVGLEPPRDRPVAEEARRKEPAPPTGEETISAPLPGLVVEVRVREGEEVEVGQVLLVLEAMKMENEIPSPRAGRVSRVLVKPGEAVNVGDPLLVLETR